MKDIKADKNKIKYYLIINIMKMVFLLFVPIIVFFLMFNLMKDDSLTVLLIFVLVLLSISITFIVMSLYELYQESLYDVSIFKKELVFKNKKKNNKYVINYLNIDSVKYRYYKNEIKSIKIKENKNVVSIRLYDLNTLNEIKNMIMEINDYEINQE